MSRVHGEELPRIAEQAGEWLHRLPTAARKDRLDFFAWLRQSPLHVREFLAAVAWQHELHHLGRERPIDMDALIEIANSNVIPMRISVKMTGYSAGM